MIHFNELYITDDNKLLVIDVEIDDMPEFSSCYIDNITLSLGEDCGKNDKRVVTIYEREGAPVGDIDEDGEITKKDIELWNLLFAACTNIKYDDDKEQYYVLNFKDPDDNVYTKRYLSEKEYNLYNDIVTNYKVFHPTLTPNLAAFFNYLGTMLGNKLKEIFKFASETLPGDLNNDEELNNADILMFIEYLITNTGVSQVIQSDTIFIDKNHVRLCLSPDSEQLAGLFSKVSEDGKITLAKEFPNELFIVTATAGCGDASVLANLSCSEDVSCITGVAYNGQPLYDTAVRYADNYGNTCDTKDMSPFLDWLLRYYGFIFALENGDICQAQYYWSTYLTNGAVTSSSFSKSCGCHGTYYQRF